MAVQAIHQTCLLWWWPGLSGCNAEGVFTWTIFFWALGLVASVAEEYLAILVFEFVSLICTAGICQLSVVWLFWLIMGDAIMSLNYYSGYYFSYKRFHYFDNAGTMAVFWLPRGSTSGMPPVVHSVDADPSWGSQYRWWFIVTTVLNVPQPKPVQEKRFISMLADVILAPHGGDICTGVINPCPYVLQRVVCISRS